MANVFYDLQARTYLDIYRAVIGGTRFYPGTIVSGTYVNTKTIETKFRASDEYLFEVTLREKVVTINYNGFSKKRFPADTSTTTVALGDIFDTRYIVGLDKYSNKYNASTVVSALTNVYNSIKLFFDAKKGKTFKITWNLSGGAWPEGFVPAYTYRYSYTADQYVTSFYTDEYGVQHPPTYGVTALSGWTASGLSLASSTLPSAVVDVSDEDSEILPFLGSGLTGDGAVRISTRAFGNVTFTAVWGTP